MDYIDIHCHLDFPDYDKDREAVLSRMRENNINAITIGTDLESSKKAVKIAEQNENVWACIGVHPEECQKSQGNTLGNFQGVTLEFDEKEFEKLVKNSKVVAIGECGLDYFRRRSLGEGGLSENEKESQKELFEKQIEFAVKHNKSLMLHIRSSGRNNFDAYKDALNILESYKKDSSADRGKKLRGNIHFFAGNVDIAKRFLDIGFTMSFTGVITFTHDYNEVIKFLPIESIMSETDAPFVTPVPYRSKRNEPTYIIEVVKKLAKIRGENINILNNQILENFKRVFGT